MKFMDKLKDLYTDEEEVIETKEIEVPKEEEKVHKLPTFMRNKLEEEQKREEIKKEKEIKTEREVPITPLADREIVKTRSNSFSFPIDIDEPEEVRRPVYNNRNVNVLDAEKTVSSLYTKKDEPKPKRFKPTPVISPVYGVLDKNYTKDEVKLQNEDSYEIQRPSRKVDFETVRNKAFGTLTDDIKNNLCENCELYQEVKITKHADKKKDDINLLENLVEDSPKEDISLGDAEDNYFDFGVDYEPPKKEPKEEVVVVNADKVDVEVNNDIKIVNHNDEESTAEKIEVKEEPPKIEKKDLSEEKSKLGDTKEFEKITHDEEDINSILGNNDEDIPIDSNANNIFNLIDSMYDEEEK